MTIGKAAQIPAGPCVVAAVKRDRMKLLDIFDMPVNSSDECRADVTGVSHGVSRV